MRVREILLALTLAGAALAAQAEALIAIVIDDMGDLYSEGRQAIALPGALTFSFLPHTPYAVQLAKQAHAQGRGVMLHLPMQAERGNRLGPGGITQAMSEDEFRQTLRENLAAVPHLRGVNNHMGSLLTRRAVQMDWVMSELQQHAGLFFVDSMTSLRSIARYAAQGHQIPTTRRDVFLDNQRDRDSIRRQFALLLSLARERGAALAIGHPYPATLQVLAEVLPALERYGVRLVPASRLIAAQQQRSPQLWHASLSP